MDKEWLNNLPKIPSLMTNTKVIYDNFINNFDSDPNCKGYKVGNKRPTDKDDIKLIATEIYCYFPAHYFKVWHTLVMLEKNLRQETLFPQLITIIDIGCSIGTATYVYLDLLKEKISSLMISGKIRVHVVFVELSSTRINLLKEGFTKYINNEPEIAISYKIINIGFPKCLNEILESIDDPNDNILIFSSNIISWLNSPESLTKGIHNLFLNCLDSNDLRALNIEGAEQKEKLKKAYKYIDSFGVYNVEGPEINKGIKYYNPINSVWAKMKKIYTNPGYVYGSIHSLELTKFLSLRKNLKHAFQKAYLSYKFNPLHDEIEVKYVTRNIESIIEMLREDIANGYRYTNEFMEYNMPKNSKEFRPYVIEDFLNEIVNAAFAMSLGMRLDIEQDKNGIHSFGNRLESKMESPYIFLPFVKQYYKKYLDQAKNIIESGEVTNFIQLDIKSFYTNITKNLLKKQIDYCLPDKLFPFRKSLKSFMDREYKGCLIGKGLPQGTFISAILANFYLSSFDNWLVKNHPDIFYHRYVDDCLLLFNDNISIDKLNEDVEKYLKNNLDLDFNIDKSKKGLIGNLRLPTNDIYYSEITSRIQRILRTIYKIDGKIYKKMLQAPERTSEILHSCLNNIGIYIPAEWLFVKVEKETSFLQKMFEIIKNPIKWFNSKKIYSKINIEWGKLPSDLSSISKWQKKFEQNNSQLLTEISNLKSEMVSDFKISYNILMSSETVGKNQEKEVVRKLKFTFNKLGMFTSSSIIEEVKKLFNKPWLINLYHLRAYPELRMVLLNEVRKKQYEDYKFLIGLRVLGEIKETEILPLLQEVFFDSLTTDLKLINCLSAEALFRINIWTDFESEKLRLKVNEWIKRKKDDDYILIRNAFLIMCIVDKESDELIKIIDEGITVWEDKKRIVIFLTWLKSNLGVNLFDSYDYLSENMKRQYPLQEPEGNEYGYI